jgi:hypothetical protein
MENKKATFRNFLSNLFYRMSARFIVISFGFLSILILSVCCMSGAYIRGQQFPELSNVKGTGTILFFYLENMELYQAQDELFDEAGKVERLINRLKVDINRLKEEYFNLRVEYVDTYENRNVVIIHRVYGIPTIILFDRMGYEVRRWLPGDFERGGGSLWEMKKVIDKL